MIKYLLNRLLRGLISVIIVVAIVMILIYSLMDRELIFAQDPQYSKNTFNKAEIYKCTKWEGYGYIDYVPYSDYLAQLRAAGEIDEQTKSDALKIAKKSNAETHRSDNDPEIVKEYVEKFITYYEGKGYTVQRLDFHKKTKQKAELYAYKDVPITTRLVKYFGGLFAVDNIHYVEKTTGEKLENTGIKFTLFDPVYNTNPDKKVFAPAIMGNGTRNKYLLYVDNVFPYVHQNLVTVNLGLSYSVNKDIDVFNTLADRQDPNFYRTVTFPTGLTEESPRNLHTAQYVQGSRNATEINQSLFTDDYTDVRYFKKSFSKTGFSFIIGIIAVFVSYLIGVPLGILMARKKDKLVDKLGTIYIVFIIAVPSLAYIFLFRELGGMAGLPKSFSLEEATWLMYVLPVISLALPSIAGLMKWLRRYMIDQLNSDYVKFARSGGLSEGEIFTKHILKNAIIPIAHGIPAELLGALVGAIITESIYRVPGAGYLLTDAIGRYDNGVIVGLTMFYAVLSIVSLIFGDILMSLIDPRISFTEKAR